VGNELVYEETDTFTVIHRYYEANDRFSQFCERAYSYVTAARKAKIFLNSGNSRELNSRKVCREQLQDAGKNWSSGINCQIKFFSSFMQLLHNSIIFIKNENICCFLHV
jgi:DNA-binding transcriptional regulator GbsR (MarR family)